MTENTGFAAFALYNALKIHFSSDSYDFFKYNGKTNVSKQSFTTRKDKYSFYKLSRKYSLEDLRDFYIANFLCGDVSWVGEMTGPDGEKNYKEWQKRNQRLTYQFEQDIIFLFESSGDCLHVDNGNHPYLLTMLMRGEVMIETVVILNDLMGFLPMWKKKIVDDIIWPTWCQRIEKYTPFVRYDKVKFKSIVKEQYENQ